MKIFTPPGRSERRGKHRLFGRLTITQGVSLLKRGGLYRQVLNSSSEDVDEADIAYLGGHIYLVTDAEAADLTLAGYGEWIDEVS